MGLQNIVNFGTITLLMEVCANYWYNIATKSIPTRLIPCCEWDQDK